MNRSQLLVSVGLLVVLAVLPALAAAAALPVPPPHAATAPNVRDLALRGPAPLSGVVAFPPLGATSGPTLGPTADNTALMPWVPQYRVTNNPEPQNEVSIAVNPQDVRNLVAGANDLRGYPGLSQDYWCGVYATLDGGHSWREQLVPRNGPLLQVGAAGDPSVAFDAQGNAYFTCLGFDRSGGDNVITVSKSADGGVTWGTASLVVGTVAGVFHDKQYIAVDASANVTTRGNVYITWTRFRNLAGGECGNYEAPIYISRSTDGGLTFSPEMEVSGAGFRCSQGSQPAVGPDGELYVSWYNWNGGAPRVVVTKSTDGGLAFGPRTVVSNMVSAGEIYGGAPRTPHFPSMAVNPVNTVWGDNRVHVVWTDRRFGNPDIVMSTSADGGVTWSALVRVNDDVGPAAQFFPWVSASATGRVDIVFYDQRDDPARRRLTAHMTSTLDFGATFLPNLRVSAQFDPGSYFIGDYIGIASSGPYSFPAWCDRRNDPNDEVYMVGLPTPRVAPVTLFP